jgi:signal transduction histidine kinase
MTSYHPDRVRGPLGWFAASGLAWLAGLSCWTLAGLPKVVAAEGWILVAGCIPLFQGLAAWSPRSVEEALLGGGPEGRLPDLLPYLPVILALLMMTGLLAWAPAEVSRGAMALFLVMVVLMLLRQFQAVVDLLRARKTLNEQVLKRTKALRQAQDTLLRTERMNTLALMGAGLAHDLNNLLCAMKGTAELAAMNLQEGLSPSQGDLDRIATSADRAASLTRRLMEFVRREEESLAPTDLGRELRDMEPDLRLLLPNGVAFRLEIAGADPLVVMSSRLRLEQMLVNLVANAVDAMPAGGSLRVGVAPEGDGGQVLIEVADSGEGMDSEILARIFDPFFTTKPPGKGTGLGLSSLKAMVEEGEGRLEVDSEPGQGSRFRILLPRLDATALSPR